MEKSRLGILLIVLLIGFVFIASHASAVAPHPDLIEKWKNEGVLDQKLANLRAFREAGGCSAEEHTPIRKDRFGGSLALGTDYIDIYQFHEPSYDPDLAPAVMETLEALVAEGKIRYYGWSTDLPDRAGIFAGGEHCTAIQFALNINHDNPDTC